MGFWGFGGKETQTPQRYLSAHQQCTNRPAAAGCPRSKRYLFHTASAQKITPGDRAVWNRYQQSWDCILHLHQESWPQMMWTWKCPSHNFRTNHDVTRAEKGDLAIHFVLAAEVRFRHDCGTDHMDCNAGPWSRVKFRIPTCRRYSQSRRCSRDLHWLCFSVGVGN